MIRVRLRLLDYALIGAMFFTAQSMMSMYLCGISLSTLWAQLLEFLVHFGETVPEHLQAIFGASALAGVFVLVIVSGVLVDIVGSVPGHNAAVMHLHLGMNRHWILKLPVEDSAYAGEDVDYILKHYETIGQAIRFWRKNSQATRETLSIARRAERLESLIVARVLQGGEGHLIANVLNQMYQLRIVRAFFAISGIVALQPVLSLYVPFVRDPSLVGSLVDNALLSWIGGFLLRLVPATAYLILIIPFYHRAYSRYISHLLAAYYILNHKHK